MVSPVPEGRGALVALLLLASVAGLVPGARAQCGSLKLLAIGDSLTLGSIPSEARNHPYVFVTKHELQQELGCFDVEASVAAQGGSGIHVRNVRTLPEAALPMLRGEKWDYVCIMAGINDLLLGGKSADDIWWGGLKAMYDEALDSGAHVVGMLPLPTALLNGWDYREKQRKKIGELIYNYSRQRKNIIVLYYGVDWTYEQKAAYLESDKLHMNEAGHTQLGKEVAKVIRAAMGPDPCSKCARYENDPRAGPASKRGGPRAQRHSPRPPPLPPPPPPSSVARLDRRSPVGHHGPPIAGPRQMPAAARPKPKPPVVLPAAQALVLAPPPRSAAPRGGPAPKPPSQKRPAPVSLSGQPLVPRRHNGTRPLPAPTSPLPPRLRAPPPPPRPALTLPPAAPRPATQRPQRRAPASPLGGAAPARTRSQGAAAVPVQSAEASLPSPSFNIVTMASVPDPATAPARRRRRRQQSRPNAGRLNATTTEPLGSPPV